MWNSEKNGAKIKIKIKANFVIWKRLDNSNRGKKFYANIQCD